METNQIPHLEFTIPSRPHDCWLVVDYRDACSYLLRPAILITLSFLHENSYIKASLARHSLLATRELFISRKYRLVQNLYLTQVLCREQFLLHQQSHSSLSQHLQAYSLLRRPLSLSANLFQ